MYAMIHLPLYLFLFFFVSTSEFAAYGLHPLHGEGKACFTFHTCSVSLYHQLAHRRVSFFSSFLFHFLYLMYLIWVCKTLWLGHTGRHWPSSSINTASYPNISLLNHTYNCQFLLFSMTSACKGIGIQFPFNFSHLVVTLFIMLLGRFFFVIVLFNYSCFVNASPPSESPTKYTLINEKSAVLVHYSK